jgi:hypothetical protein
LLSAADAGSVSKRLDPPSSSRSMAATLTTTA